MTGIIVTGHGNYPTGLKSAVELVAGVQESFETVDFTAGMSTEELGKELEKAVEAVGTEEILVLTDLLGGSPFNTISIRKGKLESKHKGKRIKVLAGVNLGMMVEAVFARGIMDLDSLAADVMQAGRDGVKDLDELADVQEPELEDGL